VPFLVGENPDEEGLFPTVLRELAQEKEIVPLYQ
jgi:hypothetical protein